MKNDTASKPDEPSAADIAREADVVAPIPVRPLDADWPEQQNKNKGFEDEDADDEPYGDPASVKNESPLESLGEAISEPVRDGAKR